jgi:protein-disulfide isomerase
VAIVEFGDLECPACAHANPLLKQAAAKYNIPWVRHDFLIPYHNWSKNAAVDARWFDSKNKALGDEYRDEIFANQRSIETAGELSQFTEKYAQSHGVALPFAIDPQGKLLGAVNADSDLGRRLGITQTPTIWVVTANSSVKVANPDTDLYSTIDQAMANTKMAHN